MIALYFWQILGCSFLLVVGCRYFQLMYACYTALTLVCQILVRRLQIRHLGLRVRRLTIQSRKLIAKIDP